MFLSKVANFASCGAPLRRIAVDVYRVLAAGQQVAGVDDVLLGDAEDQVGVGVADVVLDHHGEAAEVDLYGHFGGIERVIGQRENGLAHRHKHPGQALDVALKVFALAVGFGLAHALFPGLEVGGQVLRLPLGVVRGHTRRARRHAPRWGFPRRRKRNYPACDRSASAC